jgi:serine phosphatase RsbU (regulator of sigma subunit)
MINRSPVTRAWLRIPPLYRREWEHKMAMFVRRRIGVTGAVLVAAFFVAQGLQALIAPTGFNWQRRMNDWVTFVAGNALILALNIRPKTLRPVKAVAYLYPIFFIGYTFFLFLSRGPGLFSFPVVLLLSLFTISLIIPWDPVDLIVLTVLHIAALFFYAVFQPLAEEVPLMLNGDFVEGLAALVLAGALCAVLRINESNRDIETFVLMKENERKSLEIERKNIQIEKQSDRINRELEFAVLIHRTLVPQSVSNERVDIEVTYRPTTGVGGDYAEIKFPDEDRMLIIVCDVTGHGVPAALLVNRLHAEFQHLSQECPSPGILLGKLNEFIQHDFAQTGMYLSAFCGLADFRRGRLAYSNYGHPAPFLLAADKSGVEALGSQSSLLGVRLDEEPGVLHEKEVPLAPGDRLLLFTDGVVEATDEDGDSFGESRLGELLLECRHLPPGVFNRRMVEELDRHRSGEIRDDILAITVQIK